MTLFVFLAHQLHAEVSKDCLTGILNETENTCLAKSDIINEINKDYYKVKNMVKGQECEYITYERVF